MANCFSSNEIVKDTEDELVKKHLNIIVLKILKDRPLNGYSIICLMHKRYGVLLGAGMVYNLLNSMEKKRLIKRSGDQKVKYYLLTKGGEQMISVIINNQKRIRHITDSIFG
jgi:DNA-binding PadR family transcriptional regulator